MNSYQNFLAPPTYHRLLKQLPDQKIKLNKKLVYFNKLPDLTIILFANQKLLLRGRQEEIIKFLNQYELSKSLSETKVNLNNYEKYRNFLEKLRSSPYYGCDESGVGDLFGPVVFTAYYWSDKVADRLRSVFQIDLKDIIDSKAISETKIKLLAAKLIKGAEEYHVLILKNEEFNQQFHYKMNLKELLTYYHLKNLEGLSSNSINTQIIIDGFLTIKKFNSYRYKWNFPKWKINLFNKSENDFLGVAAASIIARSLFIEEMNKIKQKINFINGNIFGANQKIKELIQDLKKEQSSEVLKTIIKIKYKNY